MTTIMEEMNKNGLSTKQPTQHDLEKLDKALSWIEDTLQRAQISFLLLGETAKSVIEKEQVEGDKLEIGIRKRYLTPDTMWILKLLVPDAEVKDNKIVIDYQGLPIEIKILEKDYQVIENPQLVWYKITEYFTPNPFEKYWKMRSFVR